MSFRVLDALPILVLRFGDTVNKGRTTGMGGSATKTRR